MQQALIFLILLPALVFSQKKEQRIENITLKSCLMQALKNNLDLKIEGYNPRIAEQDILTAQSEFDPLFTSTARFSNVKSQQVNVFDNDDNEDIINRFDIGVQKKHLLGGTLSFKHSIDYFKQLNANEFVSVLNPRWTHAATFAVTQPLLRNMGINVNLTNTRIARNNHAISLYLFYGQLSNVLFAVQTAYFDLINTRENYELQRKSLKTSENLYKITRARIKAGSLAAADILRVESEIAFKRDNLITAEKNVLDAEDQLKQLIRPLDLNYYNNVRLLPIDRPNFERRKVELEKSLHYALKFRYEIKRSLLTLENTSLDTSFRKNQLLPKLDLSSSLEFRGISDNSPDAFEFTLEGNFPRWNVQLSLEIPLGNRRAKAQYKKALLERRKAEMEHRALQNRIIIEVRGAVRALKTASKKVQTARRTREITEKQLANEENKFRAGIIALFEVQDTEQRLTEARISEIAAKIDYQKAIINLDKAEGKLLEALRKYGVEIADEQDFYSVTKPGGKY